MSREGGMYIRQGTGNPNRGRRRKFDLLLSFRDFVVNEVLDYLWCFRGKEYPFLLSVLSLSLLCSIILNLNPQKGSRWNDIILLACFL